MTNSRTIMTRVRRGVLPHGATESCGRERAGWTIQDQIVQALDLTPPQPMETVGIYKINVTSYMYERAKFEF